MDEKNIICDETCTCGCNEGQACTCTEECTCGCQEKEKNAIVTKKNNTKGRLKSVF